MVVPHFAFAFFTALILSVIFALGSRKRAAWRTLSLTFAIIFLASWAGGAWMSPFGPPLWGVTWLPFVAVGLLIALLLAAAAPPRGRRTTVELVGPEEKKRQREEETLFTAAGIFLWIFLAAVLVAIFLRYL
jgi:hypothetical protein